VDETRCPWAMIERLEAKHDTPGFWSQWQGFVQACGVAVLPGLPAEAKVWVEAAGAYGRGELPATNLAELATAALRLYQSRRGSDPWPVQCGLLVTMTTLGTGLTPPGGTREPGTSLTVARQQAYRTSV